MNKIPVTIFTGFLGVGKTTLLNQTLKHFREEGNAVIENEFGEVAIDGDLVKGACQDLYELNDGCLCCGLNEEFYRLLKDIVSGKKKPKRLWVEATGVADTTALIAMFRREDIAAHFDLWRVLCIVDATNIRQRILEAVEVSRQIIASDTVIINKTTGMSDEEISSIKQLIRGVNEFARIEHTDTGELPMSLFEEKSNASKYFPLEAPQTRPVGNAHKINSVAYETDRCFDLLQLECVLGASLWMHANQIFRIKGIVRSKDGRKVLLQAIGRDIKLTTLGDWNEQDHSKVTVIGRGLQDGSIDRMLKRATRKVPEITPFEYVKEAV